MKRLNIVVFIFVIFAANACPAFHDTGMGARPTGMSGVFTGIADESYTLYYNPAGLGIIKSPEISSTYAKLFTGTIGEINPYEISFNYVQTFKYDAYGISWQSTHLAPYYKEETLALGYGRGDIAQSVSFGFNLKLRSTSIEKNESSVYKTDITINSSALCFDTGFLYEVLPNIQLGLSLADFNQPDIGGGTLPLIIRLGGSYRTILLDNDFLAGIEVVVRGENNKLLLGSEYWILKNMFCIRAGTGIGTNNFNQISLGCGLEFILPVISAIPVKIEYSCLSATNSSDNHRISLDVSFAEALKPKEQPEIKQKPVIIELAKDEKDKLIEELLRLADEYFRQKEYKNSERKYREVLQLDADNKRANAGLYNIADAYVLLGQECYNKEEFSKSIVYTESALSVRPDHEKALALIFMPDNLKNLKLKPLYEEALKFLYPNKDDYQKEDGWNEALALLPDYRQARDSIVKTANITAIMSYVQGKINEALTLWEELILLDPANDEIKKFIKATVTLVKQGD